MVTADQIFSITDGKQFGKLALKAFRLHHDRNPVYRRFCDHLAVDPAQVKTLQQIPFLPIQFFKAEDVILDGLIPEVTFTSSGTTGASTSRHLVADPRIYRESFRRGFAQFYGNIEDYCVLALLPSYLEREGSSLVLMADDMIKQSNRPDSGFHLHDLETLADKLVRLDADGQNIILLGVTYALLDLAEKRNFKLNNTIVMETGGMKGKRREMIREELHDVLKKGFGVSQIHSEYGMTELLSQAYSLGEGKFQCPPWMAVMARDPEDPLSGVGYGRTGGLNIVDLANINSCPFIATQDLGRCYADWSFEVLGRFDHADIRGCNLMAF